MNKKQNLYDRVYEIVKQIPKGYVTTYQDIAIKLGNKNYARIVGNALHNNPNEKEIPCYKVLNSKGQVSKNFAFGGEEEQIKRLRQEKIVVENGIVDLKKYRAK